MGQTTSIAGGYLSRLFEGRVIHRINQEVSISQPFHALRLTHRVAADQTFYQKFAPQYRLRYRISLEIPLKGHELDPKEFYFKGHNEYLISYQEDHINMQIRLIPMLGYNFSERHRIEGGIDYRLDSILRDRLRNVFWLSIDWLISL